MDSCGGFAFSRPLLLTLRVVLGKNRDRAVANNLREHDVPVPLRNAYQTS